MEEALIKRILPHSIEAEQSVIGSMILDRDAILVASETVEGVIQVHRLEPIKPDHTVKLI